MTSEAEGLLLSDGGHSVFLHPPIRYSDGYGFSQRVDLVAGPFRGSIDVSSYVGPGALGSFHEQLLALHKSLAGEARLPDAYDSLKITLTGDGLGHVTVHVDAITGAVMDTRLSFNFKLDQTHLPRALAVIEEWIQKD